MKNKQTNQAYLLLFIVLIAFIGITIPIPILTPLFLNPQDNGIIPLSWNHESRSLLLGIVIAIYPFGQFIGSPILGKLSDQYGRKRALIYTLLGAGFGYLLTALAIHYKFLLLLIGSRLLTGFLEGNIAIARAAIGDLGEVNKHSSFGKVSAAATTGRIIGPLLGGFFATSTIVKWFNFDIPFFIGTITLFGTALMTIIFLQETLSEAKRAKPSIEKSYRIISRIDKLGNSSYLKSFLIVWIFIVLATDTFDQYFPAFLVGKWHMTPIGISLFSATLSIWYVAGSAWLVPLLARKIQTITAIRFGILFFGISLFFMLIPNNNYWLFPIFALCDLATAMVLVNFFVLISDFAKQEHQGEAMGMMLSLRTFTDSIIGFLGGLLITLSPTLPVIVSATTGVLIFIIMKTYITYGNKKYY